MFNCATLKHIIIHSKCHAKSLIYRICSRYVQFCFTCLCR